ncbi:MAG: hypothetical protein IKS90_03895 [Clostridia bacterium]|nr:hypothetical protein [Clostridia bacterium]
MKNNKSLRVFLRITRILLSHITIYFAVLILICYFIDRVNTAMEFISSPLSKTFIMILAFLALITSVLNIIALWHNPDKRRERKRRS